MKIGIFDSGIGGLNVLDDFLKAGTKAEYIYVGDNFYVPYGTKTQEELEKIITRILNFFEKQSVDAIFIACNTASCASKNLKTNVPIYRIIEPTCVKAREINKSSSKPIALLATNFTVSPHAYDDYLDNIIGVKASAFVPLCEQNLMDTDYAKKVIADTLKDIKGKCDTIILGCTHFRLLKKQIIEYLGPVKIVDSCASFTDILKDLIGKNQLTKDVELHIIFTKKDKINIDWFNHPYKGIDFIDIK